jgi:hypothetical protein
LLGEVGMRALAFCLLASSFVVACASQSESSAPTHAAESDVVGGRARGVGEYRSVGLLVGQVGLCTATLVAPQIVLTATHCSRIAPMSFCVDDDCAPTEIARSVPEEWLGAGACPAGGDMSLYHLARPITSVEPLAVDDVTVGADAVCDVVGYGGGDNSEATVGRLQVTERAGSGLKGRGVESRTDVGDSGGPVICDGKLAAITSCGIPGSAEGWYVTTHAFHSWLRETIDDWSRPAECARFDTRCEQAADHDEMWSCDDLGHWRLLRACPVGNCYATPSRAGCPD